ncbi:O-linked N-acetylglucosamine transferase, SPINDLY family protein [Paraburkholderia lycopersici]|uniref:protein O-GlcNAc transferase n=1 Tax=Paraburkholderia lycopersici TaxID=416944 RepID=A0A1G6T719_9BURK|nr:tetratricopeptide repeat protein [Paraburkholderia lycopersici]SDD24356.1 Predicted O-linked N-acetylglucosamine transferase, SPINDLY family [Paraburkholderia lycopersici]
MNHLANVVVSEYADKIRSAWRSELSLGDAVQYGTRLTESGQPELAEVLYQTWLAHNETPFNYLVLFNLGAVQSTLDKVEDARQTFSRVVELSPAFVQGHVNRAIVYERLGKLDVAITEWMWVANSVSPRDEQNAGFRLQAFNNLGRLYETQRNYSEALAWLAKSLEANPSQPDVLHHWIFLRAKSCSWPVYEDVPGVDPALMRRSTSTMAMIAQSDDLQEQLDAARKFVSQKINCDVPALAERCNYGHDKIRIGYLSSDLCQHPVAMLMVELLEQHDRERVEVYCYCWTKEDGSALRQRVIGAVDHFERIGGFTDEAAAHLIRSHEIDILVDLHGQTLGARPAILAARPAPVQVTYLGLVATTGFPFIDYVIADEFVIPEESTACYTETPIYMPDVYQVSDRKRTIAPAPTRAACNLPEDGVVFCSFNNNYKYTPEAFDTWMRILARVPGSVLWLLSDNPWAEANLRKEAQARGIDPQRLVFAPRVFMDQYLARYLVADLFLDTFPYNAGTTANDALWTGLPIVTRSGRSFASRMAGALLSAAGMPELITWNWADYEEKAVSLALAPQERLRLRDELAAVRERGALFDTTRFARNLEEKFSDLLAALPLQTVDA